MRRADFDKELRSLSAFIRALKADLAAAAMWAQQVNPALGAIDRSTVDQIDAHSMEARVWTVNAGTDILRRG